MFEGVVQVDRKPVASCRVLLISEDLNHLLASITTDESGVFRFSSPNLSSISRAVILAKVQGPVLAIAHRVVDISEDPGPFTVTFDTSSGEFHRMSGQIASGEGWPPYLLLHVDPVHLAGVPAPLEKFFNTVDDQVVESWFYQQRLDGPTFEIRVQEGSYRFDVHYFNKSRAEWAEPVIQDYWMNQVTADDGGITNLEAPFSSYLVTVDRDREMKISIAAIKAEP